jgi:hypothetical protein
VDNSLIENPQGDTALDSLLYENPPSENPPSDNGPQ